jgi:peptidoglycan/xylan/chitin deacetylase (PgdA/CDA1 family)
MVTMEEVINDGEGENMGDAKDVEELSFGDSVSKTGRYSIDDMDEFDTNSNAGPDGPSSNRDNGPSKKSKRWRSWLMTTLALIALTALTCSGIWAYGMWQNHWRRIQISVNGNDRMTRVDTTLGTLMTDNEEFGFKPGKLLSLTGKVINKRGGEPISYTINGHSISPKAVSKTVLPEDAAITLTSGADVTEEHETRHDTIPFTVTMNGQGTIQLLKQAGKDGTREIWVGKDSHEEVDKGVIEQPQNLVVTTIAPKPADRKVIALTFDDGPSEYSAPILDVLKEKGVKATFFDLGENSLRYPQAEQRMVAEGHQVASHSNTHPDMTTISNDAMRDDITKGFANIKATSGVTTKVLRAPYGDFGEGQWKNASDLISCNVLWTIDTEDWQRPGAQAIHDAVLANAYNGAVVLMHDGGGDRSQDVEALPKIIDDLKAQGYQFVTIDQLIAMDGA